MKMSDLFRVAAICTWITTVISCSQSPSATQITVNNHSDAAKTDELVVLPRKILEEGTGTIGAGKYVLLTDSAGQPVVVQYDDLDGDKEWDEMAFLYSVPAHSSATLTMQFADQPATVKAVVRAHARHRKINPDKTFGPDLQADTMPEKAQPTDFTKQALPPFLTEGPTWENDKVGFRLYFDVRNGKDIWGKTTAAMVLDEVGADTTKSYHELADWGMDILKVGKSLGAGSLALSVPLKNGTDSLVRLGGENIKQVTYQKLADGPVRAIIRLQYNDWIVAEGVPPVTVTEDISIWGGQYFYESKVTVSNAPAGAKLTTGIVNLHSRQAHTFDTAGIKVLYTYDAQSEHHDKLGMAVLMAGADFNAYDTTSNAGTEILNTYVVKQNLPAGRPVSFRFYSGWERSDPRFATQEGFEEFMKQEAARYGMPATVEIK